MSILQSTPKRSENERGPRMSEIEITLAALREAIRLAPDNVPLTEHFVRTLLSASRFEEAENAAKDCLARNPNVLSLKILLADVYYRQQKNSHALAILESLMRDRDPPPTALVLFAKLMYRAGEVATAVARYRQAIEADESVADEHFANLLGINPKKWSEENPFDHETDSEDDEDEVSDGRIRQMASSDQDGFQPAPMERPKIRFADVGGMEKVKDDIRVKIIYPIEHAEMYAAYGKKVGGGILMYGPPGCGKTYLARATAGEVKAAFMSIGINDVLDMWLGNSERNLHSLFKQARQHRPCVLFFDEVDALGASRSDMRQSAGRHLVNQFLAELDGANSDNEGILVLGATNAPWHVDAAFRRPGRFDQVLFVPPPDQVARAEILKLLLAGKPTQDLDVEQIASKAPDFSGADLKAVVDRATEIKLQEAIKTGRPTPLLTKDLLHAVKIVRPTTREWFATARNHALYSNQGGVYDDILQYLKIK